jgi:hypothetical protein
MVDSQTARDLFRVFQEQGVEVVYAVSCCERVYLGREPAVKCRTCDKHPKSKEIRTETDLDNL